MSKRTVLGAALVWAVTAAVAAPASAQSPAAQKMKTDLDDFVKKMVGTDGKSKAEGEVKVVDGPDGALIATLPAFALASGEGVLTFPTSGFTYRVIDADHIATQATFPNKFTFTPAKGGAPVTVSLGGQTATCVWRPSIMTCDELKFSLTDILVDAPDDGVKVGLKEFGVLQTYRETTPGVWAGDSKIYLDKFAVANAKEKVDLSWDKLDVVGVTENWRLKEYAAAVAAAGLGPLDSVEQIAKGKTWDQAMNTPVLMQKLADIAGPMKIEYILSGLQVVAPDPSTKAPSTFKIGRTGLKFAMLGDGAGATNIPLTISLNGLSLPPHMQPPTDADLVPTDAVLSVSFNKLPLAQLLAAAQAEMLTRLAQKKAAGAASPDVALQEAMSEAAEAVAPQMLGAIAQKPPALEIPTLSLTAPAAAVSAKGAAELALGTPNSAIGTASVSLKNLDAVIDRFKARPSDPDAQQAMAALTFVKGMAKPTPAGNEIIYVIDFEARPDGVITANGLDLTTLMAGDKGKNKADGQPKPNKQNKQEPAPKAGAGK